METKVAYLIEMKRIVSESKTAEDFMKNMKTAYLNYKDGYLSATTKAFYSNEQAGYKH